MRTLRPSAGNCIARAWRICWCGLVALAGHEAPHLNPNWDDTFQAGEVIAVEPGLYAPELRAGIRLENNYLVTETGVELLSDFPLEL